MSLVEARDLYRLYATREGTAVALQGLSLDVRAGELLVVFGPSGSGKTTLLRILARLALPTTGTVELPARERIGYLGHTPNVYRELTALENLTLFARLYRVERERVGMLLERFGLWEARNERVSTFSRGMQQRLGLCRVLLHDPSLLVLDEPTNALDVHGLQLLDAVLDEPRLHVVATHDAARFDARATERLVFA